MDELGSEPDNGSWDVIDRAVDQLDGGSPGEPGEAWLSISQRTGLATRQPDLTRREAVYDAVLVISWCLVHRGRLVVTKDRYRQPGSSSLLPAPHWLTPCSSASS